MEVTPNGAFLQTNRGHAIDTPSGSPAAGVTIPRWQVDDLGLAWIGQHVAVGDSGAWMLAGKELNNESVTAYPTGANLALFDFPTVGAIAVRPAAAARADTLAAMVTFDQGGFNFQATVYGWNVRQGGTPTWSATLPATGNVFAGALAVSTDGNRTVAAVSNTNGTTHIRGFDNTGTPLFSYDFPAAANIRYAATDDTANRLYLGLFNGTCEIYDLNSGLLLHSQSLGGSFDAHAFSGDGKTFAYGNFGGLFVVRETTPGTWTQIASRSSVSGTYLGQTALNQDGSRCGFAEQRFSPAYDHLQIGMWDVNANQPLFSTSMDAPGTTTQLLASGLAMDAAGDSLAGISWGDSFNLTPEVFVYDAVGNRTASLDTPGSAFGLALDADGDVVVAGTKAVHANVSGNGGSVFCLDAYTQDLHVLGFPQLGTTLSFETPDGANSIAFVIADALGSSLSPFGTTKVDLQTTLATFGPVPIPVGGLRLALGVPNNPTFLGSAVHVQGVRFGTSNTLTNKVSLQLVP